MNPPLCFLRLSCVFGILITGSLAMSPQEACAQGDQLVTMCFRCRTVQVPSYLSSRYAAYGATYGPCPPFTVFTTQPQSQTRYVGGNVTFTSAACSQIYQWRFNGGNLSGATNANYAITNVQISHAGNYTVVARDGRGFETSAPATLTVLTSAVPSLLVTTTNDSGPGSLRQVILSAESVANPIVTFAAHVTGTITLATGEIPITKNLTIAGPGANVLSVSGNQASRIFEILSGTVMISGLTIRDGREIEGIGFPEENGAKARGGGIMNQSILTLTGCIISNNAVVAGRGGDSLEDGSVSFAGGGGNGSGGGVCNIGTLTMSDCSLINNSATGGEGGNDSGGNNGMGGQGYGGGVYSLGTATLTRCTVNDNHATAGIGSGGVGGGSGGGLYNELSLGLFSCTVASNSADGSPFDFGGGIYDNGTVLTIRNSTVFGNQADYGGGLSTGGADIGNTILAGNRASGSGPDCAGSITSSDYNLIQNLNGFSIAGTTTHNIVGQNALLGPLQNNGGPTLTLSLLPGSPAIDKGRRFGFITDQRGSGRPWDFASIPNATGGDGSDIGAFEVLPEPPQLDIERSANNVLLSWSTDAAGFRVQYVTALSSSNNWMAVSGTAATRGGKLYLSDPITSGNRFYRLIFP